MSLEQSFLKNNEDSMEVGGELHLDQVSTPELEDELTKTQEKINDLAHQINDLDTQIMNAEQPVKETLTVVRNNKVEQKRREEAKLTNELRGRLAKTQEKINDLSYEINGLDVEIMSAQGTLKETLMSVLDKKIKEKKQKEEELSKLNNLLN